MITYSIGEGVEAFTAGKDETLPYEVTQAHQVHGVQVARIDRKGLTRTELEGFDALIANVPGIAIGARTADCIPLLLYDELNHAVAAVHSGWKGTVRKISHEVIKCMHREYGTQASHLKAVIGPGICGRCFQVGDEVVQLFEDAGFPILHSGDTSFPIRHSGDFSFPMEKIYSWQGEKLDGDITTGHHIDLIAANRYLLLEEGVCPENILVSECCTFEDAKLNSARRDGPSCGRNINVIKLL